MIGILSLSVKQLFNPMLELEKEVTKSWMKCRLCTICKPHLARIALLALIRELGSVRTLPRPDQIIKPGDRITSLFQGHG